MGRAIPTGQWFTGSDGQRWWFDSGSVALDFAYTGGFRDAWEQLHTGGELLEWLRERFPDVDSQAGDGNLVDAKALRGAVASMASAASAKRQLGGSDVDVVNLFAATPDIPPVLAGGSRQAGRSRARAGQAMATIAREAIALFEDASFERIRECAADDCDLVFYDESRSNNRRWCSMQRCGNRAKVRNHRSRAAAG